MDTSEWIALGTFTLGGISAGVGYLLGWRREGRERRAADRDDDKLKLEEERKKLEEEKLLNERFQALWDRIAQLEEQNNHQWRENQELRQLIKQRDAQHQVEIETSHREIQTAQHEREIAQRERTEALEQVGLLKEQVQQLQAEVAELRLQVNKKDGATHG